MELLDARWTMLVVRELVLGARRFNELRRGLPKMSPTLLSKRLNELVRAGIVERRAADGEVAYRLTPAGDELRPVVEALGAWGVRWVGRLGDQDLDPKLLLWDMHRNVDHSTVPKGRTVVRFVFRDTPLRVRHWWLVIATGEVDVCDVDPGHEEAATVTAGLRDMVLVWRGDVSWADALRSGAIEITGTGGVQRALPHWFVQRFASVPRAPEPIAGTEAEVEVTKGRVSSARPSPRLVP